MALIFRSILEVDSPDLAQNAHGLMGGWLQRKLRSDELDLALDGETYEIADGCEASAVQVGADGRDAYRGYLFEKRGREEVKTTFTALQGDGSVWAWIDLERWAEDAWDGSWVPYSPGIVQRVLTEFTCSRGPNGLDNDVHTLEGDQGALLARQILDPDREVPIVVATPTRQELDSEPGAAIERASELQRRLAGVAPVYLLSTGGVSAFSREMLRAGDQMDVHSGAVRTYLPGAGSVRDMPWRHRYVPYGRLARRPPDMAARLAAPPLLRSASHQAPPAIWRTVRQLPEFGGGERDSDLVELVDVAEQEVSMMREQLTEADARANVAEAGLDREREAQSELLAEREDLVRRLRYAETQLRQQGESVEASDSGAPFVPDFCAGLDPSNVVTQAA